MTYEKQDQLLYRKQFFFGPQKARNEGWNTYSMPGENWLSAHPNLNVVQVSENGFQVTLVGFILNPENPSEDDRLILTGLCQSARTADQLIEATEPFGGRWVIFLTHADLSLVFNDAAGTRTVFHFFDSDGHAWLASQPGLLAERFGLEESVESQEFRASAEFQKRTEVWWPGEVTPFEKVKQLLPNHFLNLRTREVKRYWPNKPLVKYSLEEGTRQAAGILKGVLAGAQARFPLAMSLSSGIDSRTVFSACKDFAQEMTVFSLKYRKLSDESDDIRIPREIAQTLNLNYHVFDCTQAADEEFRNVFDRNVVGLKTDWSNIAQCRVENLPADVVVLKGSISEIMRCRYWNLGIYPRKVDLDLIVNLMALGRTSLVVKNLDRWMQDALPAEQYGYKLLDLLSWEIEIGNWYSLGHTVFDIAQEDFTPFNNRKFFNTMLGIDPKYRSYPNHIAQREIVATLWPELTRFPYTPSRTLPKRKFSDSLLYDLLRSAKKAIRK